VSPMPMPMTNATAATIATCRPPTGMFGCAVVSRVTTRRMVTHPRLNGEPAVGGVYQTAPAPRKSEPRDRDGSLCTEKSIHRGRGTCAATHCAAPGSRWSDHSTRYQPGLLARM
jgi:hypothetical protein